MSSLICLTLVLEHFKLATLSPKIVLKYNRSSSLKPAEFVTINTTFTTWLRLWTIMYSGLSIVYLNVLSLRNNFLIE